MRKGVAPLIDFPTQDLQIACLSVMIQAVRAYRQIGQSNSVPQAWFRGA